MDIVHLEIFTRADRNTAIIDVRTAITGSGGWIVNHVLFSNLSATINFRLEDGRLEKFVETLANKGYKAKILDEMPKPKGEEFLGLLSVIFVHDDPDLK